MEKILITGATGNVGMEVIKALSGVQHPYTIVAGIRNPDTDMAPLAGFPEIEFTKFDFTDASTYAPALKGCSVLFLLRPPQLSEVKKYFKPLIEASKTAGISHIIFLSVQGVENSSIIPHYKIEKLIVESGIPYTFLRPEYFMQNFTTTLRRELIALNRIYLPAGEAKFTLVDVADVGKATAAILTNRQLHQNRSYELTSDDLLTFSEMAGQLSAGLRRTVSFVSPNLLSFFMAKKREKVPTMLILVMIMLHYLPRFSKAPAHTQAVKELIGHPPTSFREFIERNKALLS